MPIPLYILLFSAGALVGALVVWLLVRGRLALVGRLQVERSSLQTRLELLEESGRSMGDTFKVLSARALEENSADFLKAVEQVERKIDGIEKARISAYESLRYQVAALEKAGAELRKETGRLNRALSSPGVRGRWGEIQLRRVVELAGMTEHCDFSEQATVSGANGRIRPDLVVHLPAGRTLVIDAKVPLTAFLKALESDDERCRKERFAEHARSLKGHIQALSKKSYWQGFDDSPEFVVLFLPGEAFFSSALTADPVLLEYGAEQGVVLATPTTLIALLKAVAFGWKQEQAAKSAREICELGRDLYKRIGDFALHLGQVGRSIGAAVDSYNKAVGSLETRLVVSARRLHELGAASGPLKKSGLKTVDKAVRVPSPQAGVE